MPKPKTKIELLELSQMNFKKLNDFIDSFDIKEQQKEFPSGTLNRNIRDVLAHLHHWHKMFLGWYEIGMKGQKPVMPAKGYTWKESPLLNKKIHEIYQNEPLNNVRAQLYGSYSGVQKIIEKHTEEELFEKKRFKWTGSTSLGAYLISNTSSHYDWAYRLIKKAKK